MEVTHSKSNSKENVNFAGFYNIIIKPPPPTPHPTPPQPVYI